MATQADYDRIQAMLDEVRVDIAELHRTTDEIKRNMPSLKPNS